MRKASVFVAIFSGTERHNWLCPEFAQFFAALTLEQRAVTVHTQHETRPIDYARNLAVRAFLASGLDWLLMADNDMGLPSNLLKLLDWAEMRMDARSSSRRARIVTAAFESSCAGNCWSQRRTKSGPS
jgi:hypothetical protein